MDSSLALYTFQYGYRYNDTSKLLNNRNYFLAHLRSISTFKNTTFIYVTDYIETTIPFPSNTIQIQVSWIDLVTKLEEYVGHTFPALKETSSFYKLCDFKPIFLLLYPEYFSKYKYVGWIDNDMWFSSELEKFILNQSNKGYSQISFLEPDQKISWGPIAVFDWNFYRTYVNESLKSENYRQELVTIFNTKKTVSFTEWGANVKNFNLSMSNVLLHIYHGNKDLKYLKAYEIVQNATIGLRNDNHCRKSKSSTCGVCTLKIKNGKSILYQEELKYDKEYEGVFICHFQCSKKSHLNPGSTHTINNATIDDVLSAGTIESSYLAGWSLIRD